MPQFALPPVPERFVPRLTEGLAVARAVAWQVSDLLLSYYETGTELNIQDKGGEEGSVTAADLAADRLILEALQSHFGLAEFAYLSEETEDDPRRLGMDWVWIVDPLDGTKDFIGRTGEFAVHIGLTWQGQAVVGVVACPAQGMVYGAARGQGAWGEGRGGDRQPLQVSTVQTLADSRAVVTRSHRNLGLDRLLAALPEVQQQNIGSIGGKLMAIATGRAELYLSVGDRSAPKDWDYCAPSLVLEEAGGALTFGDGSPLRYNRPEVVQWGTVVGSNGWLHAAVLERCQRAQAETQ
ncbi:MAG: 3'(2'),5'-bisphosphate nucleotidase CysQ family protein [Pseudanabaenaceae cyanobacterium]